MLSLWSVMMFCLPSGLVLICSGVWVRGFGVRWFWVSCRFRLACCYNIVSYVWLGWFWCCARTCG